MVAKRGKSHLSSQNTLMDATFHSSEQYSMSTGRNITNKAVWEPAKVSEKIRDRRLRFARHCCTKELILGYLWRQKHGMRKACRPTITYTEILRQDTGLEAPEMRTELLDKSVWRAITVRVQVLFAKTISSTTSLLIIMICYVF